MSKVEVTLSFPLQNSGVWKSAKRTHAHGGSLPSLALLA